MDEGIPHLQERQLLEHRDFIGLDYPSLYMCKPKRSMKRDDSKDTYKLPHRLIEKKRRDRINECIAQLKDLLPEHLKLTTLGHLEKAVVLELTLKHLKALTALTEQQHQKIIALQNGERSLKSPIQSDLDAFHSGFQTCAKEVLQYLARFESWTPREPRCVQLINHLHAVATQFLPTPQLLTQQVPLSKGTGAPTAAAPAGSGAAPCLERAGQKLEPLAHCVPVIQRTQPSSELAAAENDTDTDSGYGGEAEARPDREKGKGAGASRVTIKQEPPGEDSPAPKRMRLDTRGGGGRAPGARPDRCGRAAETRRRPAQLAGGVRRRRGRALRAAGGRRGPFLPALLLPLAFGGRRLRAALPGQERPGEVPVPGGGRRPVSIAVPRHPCSGRRRRCRRGRGRRRRLPLPVLRVVAPSREGGGRRRSRDPPATRGGAPWGSAPRAPARPHPPALRRRSRAREPGELCSGRSLAASKGNPLNPCST